MSLFGGKKKKEKDSPIPEHSDFPMKAYVYRLLPEKVGKTQVAGRVPGDFDGFHTQQDLEDMVSKLCGGGTYRCKVVKSGETKTHLGYHTFTIPGAPLIEGNPVESDGASKKAESKDNPVEKIEHQIEVEEANTKLDEIRAQRRRKQKALGLIDDDDDDDDSPATPTLPFGAMENPEVAALKASLKAMEKRLEDREREHERERHRQEMDRIKAENTAALDALRAEIRSNKKGDGSDGVSAIVNAQSNSVNAMLSASQAQTQAILTANTELIKAIMSRDPTGGVNARVDSLVEKLIDTKSAMGAEHLSIMKESFQTGIMMAKGGEAGPTSFADVAKEFSGRVLDVVGQYMHQKGTMSKEVLAQEIQKATKSVMEHVKGQIAPMMLARGAQNRALPAGGIPAGGAMPPQTAAPASNLSTEEVRQRVDKVMNAFISDIDNSTETWEEIAKQEIPPEDLARIGEFNFENVAKYAMQHGSPDVVRRVVEKLLAIGVLTPDQANQLLLSHNITPTTTASAPAQPAGAAPAGAAPVSPVQGTQPNEPDDSVNQQAGIPRTDDDDPMLGEEGDDALMDGDDGPMVSQGDAHTSTPAEQMAQPPQ